MITATWIPLKSPISFEFYSNWLDQKKHAGMYYLEAQKPFRKSPTTWAPFARSVLIFQFSYLNHPWPKAITNHLNIAKYAQGYDYHLNMVEDMSLIVTQLQSLFPDAQFKAVTDSTPLLERDLAYQAGLGWFGRNTCLISPKHGSFFLLGEVLSSIEISNPIASQVIPDLCGKCRLCVESCPTGALSEGPTLDANLCISYWNIESQEVPPDHIKSKIGSLFFGCDICQDVCPWNIKPIKAARSNASAAKKITLFTSLEDEIRFYLRASNRSILRHVHGTPLTRARPFGLRRNAIIVAVNMKLNSLKNDIHDCIARYPKLKPLKPWVLENLT